MIFIEAVDKILGNMNKPKLLIISKEYWPTSNATVTCLANIIMGLKEEYDVTLVTSSKVLTQTKKTSVDGIEVVSMGDFSNALLQFGKQYSIPVISKLCRGIHYLYSINSERNWAKVGYKLTNYFDLNTFESVVSITMPYLNLEATHHIKKNWPHLKHSSIVLDLYANNPSLLIDDLEHNKKEIRLHQEKEWFDSLDLLITTQEFLGSFKKDHSGKDSNTLVIKHPLVYDLRVENNRPVHEGIHMIYTGNFYAQLRDFSHVKTLVQNLRIKDLNIQLHVYGTKEAEVIDGMVYHGLVPKKQALMAIKQSDILLNIGNVSDTQIPSKIFEYISTGKPILNLYTLNDDLCKNILLDYPLSCSVSVNHLNQESTIQDIIVWIQTYAQQSVEFSLIKEKFVDYTPEVVNQQIIQAMKGLERR